MSQKEVFDIIVEHTREVVFELEDHAFTMEDSLKALGANSIDRSEVIMMTLESLDFQMPMASLAKAENIGALASLINDAR
ncbi:MAG: polyketide biosynthesis acyl carrier protein [Phenylobacterium sp.]|jgi:polyketide biosynthesis acyl carrier protein